MRARSRALAAGLIAAVSLTACGSAADDGPPGSGAVEPTTGSSAVSGSVTIYAAASLQAAFDELITAFEAQHPGVTVEPPVYDGSSTLVTQLIEGADADVLATADEATMADLVDAGLAGDPQSFASNTLVIAVAPDNPLGIEDVDDLAEPDLTYAVCAPEVPCGAATTELFDLDGVALDPVSQEQNVTAVAERVASGEVDAGLVYATDAAARTGTIEAVVPANAGQVVNRYPIATLAGSDQAATAFVEHVLSDEGQAVLAEHGFGAP